MIVSSSQNGITEFNNDIVMLVFLGLVTLVGIFAAVWFIAANINKPERELLGRVKVKNALLLVVAAGLAVRIVFSLVMVGYLGTNAGQPYLSTGGLLELQQFIQSVLSGASNPAGLYPIPAYLALAMGKLLDLFGVYNANGNWAMRLFIRLPYMLCDVAAAVVLFKIAKKYAGSRIGLGLAAIYMLCPIFFFGSSMWGSALSVLSLLILLSLYFMVEKNFLGLTVSYGFALLTAKEALYFLPVFGVFYVYHFIRSLKLNRASAPSRGKAVGKKGGAAAKNTAAEASFKERFLDAERGLMLRIPVYLIVSLAAMYVISLPLLGAIKYNFFTFFAQTYIYPISKVSFFGTNAFSIYNLFGRNNAAIAGSVKSGVITFIGIGFMLIATALTYVLYSSKKNRANMVLIACFVFMTLSVYSMGFSEMSLLPVLAALLLAFVLIKDKRILHIFGLLAFITVLNGCAVMLNAGFFASVPIDEFALLTATGSVLLNGSTFGMTINIICSIIAVLTHLYFTFVILDISISNKRVLFAPQNNSFGESLKDWFRFK